MSFTNLKELIELAEKEETSIAEVMIKAEIEQGGHSRGSILDKMGEQLDVMIDAVRKGTENPVISRTGLTGGDGHRVYEYAQNGNSFVNPQTLNVMSTH